MPVFDPATALASSAFLTFGGILLLGIPLLVLLIPVLLVLAIVRAFSRAAQRDSAGRADEQQALHQLLDDIERMEKRVAVLETILSDDPPPLRPNGSQGE